MAIAKKIAEQIADAAMPTSPIQKQLDAHMATLQTLAEDAACRRWPLGPVLKSELEKFRALLDLTPQSPVARPYIKMNQSFYVYDNHTHILRINLKEPIPADSAYLRVKAESPADMHLLRMSREYDALLNKQIEARDTVVQYIRSHKNIKELAEKNPDLVPFIPANERPCTAVAIVPTAAMALIIAK